MWVAIPREIEAESPPMTYVFADRWLIEAKTLRPTRSSVSISPGTSAASPLVQRELGDDQLSKRSLAAHLARPFRSDCSRPRGHPTAPHPHPTSRRVPYGQLD